MITHCNFCTKRASTLPSDISRDNETGIPGGGLFRLKLISSVSVQKSSPIVIFVQNVCAVAASCHLSVHTCNRSLFARGLSIDSRDYIISQKARWPISTPRPTCANQATWVVITPIRPKANSTHTATRHAWTRTPPRNFVYKAVFHLIYYPTSFICPWRIVPFWLGGSRYGCGLFLEQTEFLQSNITPPRESWHNTSKMQPKRISEWRVVPSRNNYSFLEIEQRPSVIFVRNTQFLSLFNTN